MELKDSKELAVLRTSLNTLLQDDNAVKYCTDLWMQVQLFDDVYDGDAVPKEAAAYLIQLTYVDIPNNPFFIAYQGFLKPLEQSMFLQWMSANRLEKDKKELEKAYMLRAFIFQIYHLCASLLHGVEYALENTNLFQSLYGETFEKYVEEFK